MKSHMRRQKEELDAKNAAWKQQQRMAGRPGATPQRPSVPEPTAPAIDKISDVTDLRAVWSAARQYLQSAARSLEGVLGHCCQIETLDPASGETLLAVPGNQRAFTSEKARAKIEEALRAITVLPIPIKLNIKFTEESASPRPAADPAQSQSAQRVPPEVMAAVQNQPLIQDLMKKLDANVTNVELIDSPEE